ncbi:Per1-like protein, partial [Scheffersomyces amazonensis]|uniref:Per1-like protein n=1 Tax=Scheffersomyces amazonensis TaxID=1078765 RepID=UPI00315C7D54
MTRLSLLLSIFMASMAYASIGDRLIEFQDCNDFQSPRFNIYSPLKVLWSPEKNCNYKCQQLITDLRLSQGHEMVQFYGKWPFVRILGMQEFYSTIFSLANFYVHYQSLRKVILQVHKNSKEINTYKYRTMTLQYLYLIVVSMFGWTLSSIFHICDNKTTEKFDYFGAGAIILTSLNCIFIRYFELFKYSKVTRLVNLIFLIVFLFHIRKLNLKWDYQYNTNFNLVIGVFSIILWSLQAIRDYKTFQSNYIIYNNSIQLLPFETKILKRINISVKHIPLLPIFFNLWLAVGIAFEIFEFTPWFRLIDGHAIWHLITAFPPLIWYDWNIWDIELLKISD